MTLQTTDGAVSHLLRCEDHIAALRTQSGKAPNWDALKLLKSARLRGCVVSAEEPDAGIP